MTTIRLSALFLIVAALAGSAGLGLPGVLDLSTDWEGILRMLCIGALVAFVVTFLVALDKKPLVRR